MAAFFYASKHKEIDVRERPSEKLINRYVITDHAVRWEDIGKLLGVKGLDNIKESCRQSDKFPEKCLKETLKKWLQIDINATWNKLEKALNQAIEDVEGISGEDTTVQSKDSASQSNGMKIQTNGQQLDAPKKETEPDTAPSGASNVAAKQLTGNDETDIGEQPNQDTMNSDGVPLNNNAFSNGASNGSSIKYPLDKVKKFDMRKYPKINKDKPAFAIIINNENFKKSSPRKGSKVDVSSIRSLEKFKGIKFHKYDLENLKADEMEGAFKRLAKHDVTTEYLSDAEIEGAWKLHYKPNDTINSEAKRQVLGDSHSINFNDYNCFMAFIMSHGNENGIAGTDEVSVHVNTLSSHISKCEGLKDKPKIFFIQACRGGKKNVVKLDGSYPARTDGITPKEADFLYVYATPETYGAGRSETAGTFFIQTLVEVMGETLGSYHLEEILFFVKNAMGEKSLEYEDGTYGKQIVSVVSQMRGRVFFDEK